MKQHQTFTNYLEDMCLAENPQIIKDQFEDFFNNWLSEQDPAFLIEWGDKYGEQFSSNLK